MAVIPLLLLSPLHETAAKAMTALQKQSVPMTSDAEANQVTR
jgi:hypothetical protein